MILIDTNLWIYLFSNQDKNKKEVVRGLIASLYNKPVVISLQIYKEIARVLNDKTDLNLQQVIEVLEKIKKICVVMEEHPNDVITALKLKNKYNLQFFDAVIYAFALNRNIPVILSEDIPLEIIEYNSKVLILKNPFK